MGRTVFFADVLGFASLAQRPGALGAVDALSDLATVLSSDNEIASLVRSDVWIERYGLSDSIFLVAEDLKAACQAAVELFFNLAYINVDSPSPVLLRGAITAGEVLRTGPIFPESGIANLVGRAVVEAVALESSGLKGPRLMVSETVAQALEEDEDGARESWPIERTDGACELLWLLPARTGLVNGTMIGEICGVALELCLKHGSDPRIGPHYRAYLALALRSLLRLRRSAPEEVARAVDAAGLERQREVISSMLMPGDLGITKSGWQQLLGSGGGD